MRRPVNELFNIVAACANGDAPAPTDRVRTHYYRDCHQLHDCQPLVLSVATLNRQPERGLCWSCVSRLAEQAERATDDLGTCVR